MKITNNILRYTGALKESKWGVFQIKHNDNRFIIKGLKGIYKIYINDKLVNESLKTVRELFELIYKCTDYCEDFEPSKMVCKALVKAITPTLKKVAKIDDNEVYSWFGCCHESGVDELYIRIFGEDSDHKEDLIDAFFEEFFEYDPFCSIVVTDETQCFTTMECLRNSKDAICYDKTGLVFDTFYSHHISE